MSTAKTHRPTDSLARLANAIIEARVSGLYGPHTDAICASFAARAAGVAVGFYKRNLQARFDRRMRERMAATVTE